MSNRFITFLGAIVMIIIVILFAIPRPTSPELIKLQQENVRLANKNYEDGKLLKENNKAKDSLNKELNKEKKQSKKLDSISKVKDKELSRIHNRYNSILNDSAKRLIEYRIKLDGLAISNEKWCLEKDDSVQGLKSILLTKNDIIENKDSTINTLDNKIGKYQVDSILQNNIILRKDSIYNNDKTIIETKDKENKRLKKENKFLKIIAGIFFFISATK